MLSREVAQMFFHYAPETGAFTRLIPLCAQASHRAGKVTGYKNRRGYVILSIGDDQYRAHHVAWLMMTGEWPKGFVVDHKNGDPTDNRWENLRLATHVQNSQNQRVGARNTSGYKGVSFSNAPRVRRPWKAQICVNKRRITLGFFDTKEEAAAAYRLAAVRHFGEFARSA